jgi:AcrR family transcriptional regulator
MGNREDLLAAARTCLLEKGYARTTARDVAGAAGTSLAAIGYHFGSKDALLTQALQGALEEWGEEVAAVLGGHADVAEAWDAVIASFARTSRLWAVEFELLAALERQPELRAALAGANREARIGLVALLDGPDAAADATAAERKGAFYQAMLIGLAATWLVDPGGMPSGPELLAALRDVAGAPARR